MENPTNVRKTRFRKDRFPVARISAVSALVVLAGCALVTTVRRGKETDSNTPSE